MANATPPTNYYHGVPLAPPTAFIQLLATIRRMGGHLKGLADGALAGQV